MIYNNTYFKEELKKSFVNGKGGFVRLLIVSGCIALMTILLNSCMSILSSTIIGDTLSAFCSRSFFSLISSMNFVILVFFIIYLGQHYDICTFAEINRNRWYMLRKTGYKTGDIVFSKQVTTLIMTIVIYISSFLILTIFSIVFSYQVTISTLTPLVVSGFMKVLFLTVVVMMFSFFTKKNSMGGLIGLLALIFIIVLENVTGFFNFISMPINMQSVKQLFIGTRSIFTYTMLGGYLLLMIITSLIAYKKANYYSLTSQSKSDIFIVDYKTNKTVSSKKIESKKSKLGVRIFVSVLVSLVMVCVILANVLIIAMGTTNKNEVFAIKGYTPLLFGSETMTGEINKNDFAVFKEVDENYEFQVGDVILYYNDNTPCVKQIKYINTEGRYVADIMTYPEGTEYGKALEVSDGSNFECVLVYTNRWLGAWLVWNNSAIGRIISLAVPVLIIVFYDKIALLLNKAKKVFDYDNDSDE